MAVLSDGADGFGLFGGSWGMDVIEEDENFKAGRLSRGPRLVLRKRKAVLLVTKLNHSA